MRQRVFNPIAWRFTGFGLQKQYLEWEFIHERTNIRHALYYFSVEDLPNNKGKWHMLNNFCLNIIWININNNLFSFFIINVYIRYHYLCVTLEKSKNLWYLCEILERHSRVRERESIYPIVGCCKQWLRVRPRF